MGVAIGTSSVPIAPGGVFSEIGPLQRVSICSSLKPESYSVSFTAIIVDTFWSSGVVSLASRPLVFAIVYSYIHSGFFQSSFGRSLCANSMKGFHIPAAQLSPSHVHFVSLPSTFPAHTTVVICGEYPAVQRSLGRIFLSPPSLTSLFDVPVFAATRRHPVRVIADLQNPSGRASVLESIVFII